MQLDMDCIGHYAFTKLFIPLPIKTAHESETGSVRVVWVSSSAADLASPTGWVDLDNLDYHKDKFALHKYAVSKGGNVLHALECGGFMKTMGLSV